MTYPSVTFNNMLTNTSLSVYDSFSDDGDATDKNSDYFGNLSHVCDVTTGAGRAIQPVHGPVSAYIAFDSKGIPVGRYVTLGMDAASFDITPQDVAAMDQSFAFLKFIGANPNDATATAFKACTTSAEAIDDFFAKTDTWKLCTFQTYMLAATTNARTPASAGKPIDQKTYSLSMLCNYLGGEWPAEFPDIAVSNFSCKTGDDNLLIKATIDIHDLPFETAIIKEHVLSILPSPTVRAQIFFNYKIGLSTGFTRLSLLFDDINVVGLKIHQPSITIDIVPLFEFVVLTIKGAIPFNIFNKKFNANLSMTIDNVEAHVGAVLDGDVSSIPLPTVMQGIHFDSIGVGIGVFFNNPGYAIGLQGKFHIGKDGSNDIAVDDDQFALVCRMDGDIPNPVYLSFYVPSMDLQKLIELYTNIRTTVNLPVTFTNLSFKWAENPMEPITLPDGSLTNMAYGFSGAVDIASLGFYGDVAIDANKGLTADLAASPLYWKDVFSLSGDGKGVTIKVDTKGNPIKNNQVPDTAAKHDEILKSANKQLIAAGGPVLRIRTLESPLLHIDARVSLFDLIHYAVKAEVGSNGISFSLDYGSILSTAMNCTLDHFHNLNASFSYGLNTMVALPSVAGIRLGMIHVQAMVGAHLSLMTSESDIILKAGGRFDFMGLTRSFGDFTVDADIKKLSGLLDAIAKYIAQQAGAIFKDLIEDAAVWAAKVEQGLIIAANTVSNTLHIAYSKTINEVAAIMRQAGFAAHDIAADMKGSFNLGVHELSSALHYAGYGANEVASALKGIFSVKEIANALQQVFSIDPGKISDVLQAVGFSAKEVGEAFKSLGGTFESWAKSAWDKLNPLHWF